MIGAPTFPWSLRGFDALLMDMLERTDWVEELLDRITEIQLSLLQEIPRGRSRRRVRRPGTAHRLPARALFESLTSWLFPDGHHAVSRNVSQHRLFAAGPANRNRIGARGGAQTEM